MTARTRWIAAGGIVAAIAGVLAVGVALTPDLFTLEVGRQAPDFRAVNLTTGDTVTLADYKGQVVLLNIWATWCPPCEEEMPAIQRLYDSLSPAGLKVAAVSI